MALVPHATGDNISKNEREGMAAIVRGQEKIHRHLRVAIKSCLQHEWVLVGLAFNDGDRGLAADLDHDAP